MITYRIITLIIMILMMSTPSVYSQHKEVFIREDFNNLENWKLLYFPKIKNHTIYLIQKEGKESFLKAESNASASGIVLKKEFKVFEFPEVKWRWKVNNIYKKGNARKKSGDDYPIRIYIIFKYNPETASFGQKIKYGLAKALYGKYPPHSTLNYIWANRQHNEKIITNTYANEAKMIILQSGKENTGKWMEQKINIIEDYHKAFGEDPPAIASLAIMSDSDNTKESAISYIDYIEVYR